MMNKQNKRRIASRDAFRPWTHQPIVTIKQHKKSSG